MQRFIICCLSTVLAGCSTTVRGPDYYSQNRLSEDSIGWEYNSRNDFMDMPDGGDTFKSRNMNIIGISY